MLHPGGVTAPCSHLELMVASSRGCPSTVDPGSCGVGFDQGAAAIRAFDGATGALVYAIAVPNAGFLNDVVAARDALYVTDSFASVLWVVPLTNRGTPAGPATAIPLSGDFEFVTEGELPVNLNGIDVIPNGKTLIRAFLRRTRVPTKPGTPPP